MTSKPSSAPQQPEAVSAAPAVAPINPEESEKRAVSADTAAEREALAGQVEAGQGGIMDRLEAGVDSLTASMGLQAAAPQPENPNAVSMADLLRDNSPEAKQQIEARLALIEGVNESGVVAEEYIRQVRAGTYTESWETFKSQPGNTNVSIMMRDVSKANGGLGKIMALIGVGVKLFADFAETLSGKKSEASEYGKDAVEDIRADLEDEEKAVEDEAQTEKTEALVSEKWSSVKIKNGDNVADLGDLDEAGRASFLESNPMTTDQLTVFEALVKNDNTDKKGRSQFLAHLSGMGMELTHLLVVADKNNGAKVKATNKRVFYKPADDMPFKPKQMAQLVAILNGSKTVDEIKSQREQLASNKASQAETQAKNNFAKYLDAENHPLGSAADQLKSLFSSATAAQRGTMMALFSDYKANDNQKSRLDRAIDGGYISLSGTSMTLDSDEVDGASYASKAGGVAGAGVLGVLGSMAGSLIAGKTPAGEIGDSVTFDLADMSSEDKTRFFTTLTRIQKNLKNSNA